MKIGLISCRMMGYFDSYTILNYFRIVHPVTREKIIEHRKRAIVLLELVHSDVYELR